MMPGMDHMLMPGMLTAEQLAQLDRATGPEFDRLFLTFMIRHHQGAMTMVKQLFETPGAAQDENVFKFVSDMNADQTTEIDRMKLHARRTPARSDQPVISPASHSRPHPSIPSQESPMVSAFTTPGPRRPAAPCRPCRSRSGSCPLGACASSTSSSGASTWRRRRQRPTPGSGSAPG